MKNGLKTWCILVNSDTKKHSMCCITNSLTSKRELCPMPCLSVILLGPAKSFYYFNRFINFVDGYLTS
jgi:hypothetical protein